MTPIADIELTLTEIDKRSAVLEATMDGVGTSLSLENEYQYLLDLRRVTVRLIGIAKQLDAAEQKRHWSLVAK